MSHKHILVRLTEKEAQMLSRAASNIMDHPDAVKATYHSQQESAAAFRAWNKLIRARAHK